MNQFTAVMYELYHEMTSKRVQKMFGLVVTLMVIVLVSTNKLFFSSYGGTASGVFTLSIALFWVGIFNSITLICRIKPRIKVQVVQGLSIGYYMMAHVVFQFIQCLIQTAVVTLMFYSAVTLELIKNCPTEGVITDFYLEFFLFAFLVVFSADMLGLMISSFAKNEVSAMTLMPFVLITEMVLSNALFPLPEVFSHSLGWLSLGMISRWGIDMFGTICNVTSYNVLPGSMIYTEWPELIYTYSKSHLITCGFALLLHSAIYILLAIALLRKIRKQSLL